MPGSSHLGKDWTLSWIQKNQNTIKRVLDVGVGGGTYRWMTKNKGLLVDADWTGVEVWYPYIEKFKLEEQYDSIINEDARFLDYDSIGKFDLAIFGDVLEHMTKEDAISAIEKALENCTRVIISIPIVHFPQGIFEDNKYEIHVKDDWSDEEVKNSFPNILESCVDGVIGVYVLGK